MEVINKETGEDVTKGYNEALKRVIENKPLKTKCDCGSPLFFEGFAECAQCHNQKLEAQSITQHND